MTGYCPGHREHYDGPRCPTCTERSRPGPRPYRRAEHAVRTRWPDWNILAPGAPAVLAVMEAA